MAGAAGAAARGRRGARLSLARCRCSRASPAARAALSARVAARTLASSAEPASVLGALRRNAEELPYNTVVKAPHWDFSLTNEELLVRGEPELPAPRSPR